MALRIFRNSRFSTSADNFVLADPRRSCTSTNCVTSGTRLLFVVMRSLFVLVKVSKSVLSRALVSYTVLTSLRDNDWHPQVSGCLPPVLFSPDLVFSSRWRVSLRPAQDLSSLSDIGGNIRAGQHDGLMNLICHVQDQTAPSPPAYVS